MYLLMETERVATEKETLYTSLMNVYILKMLCIASKVILSIDVSGLKTIISDTFWL